MRTKNALTHLDPTSVSANQVSTSLIMHVLVGFIYVFFILTFRGLVIPLKDEKWHKSISLATLPYKRDKK